ERRDVPAEMGARAHGEVGLGSLVLFRCVCVYRRELGRKDGDPTYEGKRDKQMSDAEKRHIISMLDVQAQQEIPSIQSLSLLNVPVLVILHPTVVKSLEIVTTAPATTIPPFTLEAMICV
nr:hypothetical protein [Tanacetum cinerariifolium]